MAVIYVMGGGSAVGKTTLANKLRSNLLPQSTYIMPEMCDVKILNFEIHRDHEKSAHMVREALAKAISKREDIIYDTCLADEEALSFIEVLLDEKYEVHVMFIDLPVITCQELNMKRGKDIPDNVIEDFHIRAARNFFKIACMFPDLDLNLFFNTLKDFVCFYHVGECSTFLFPSYNSYAAKASQRSDDSGYTTFPTEKEIEDLKEMILCFKSNAKV